MSQKFLSKIMPWDANGTEGAVQFILGNGLKVVVWVNDLPENIQDQLMYHGTSQKVGDAAAGFSAEKDYAGAFGMMQQVADNLANGIWANRIGSGTSDFVAALANLRNIEIDAAQAAVDAMDDEQQAKIRKHPAVKAEMARIKQERLAKVAGTDTEGLDALMDGLGL